MEEAKKIICYKRLIYKQFVGRVEILVYWGQQKIPVRMGVSILLFLSVTLLNEAYMIWKQQNGQGVLETSLKNKKDGGN